MNNNILKILLMIILLMSIIGIFSYVNSTGRYDPHWGSRAKLQIQRSDAIVVGTLSEIKEYLLVYKIKNPKGSVDEIKLHRGVIVPEDVLYMSPLVLKPYNVIWKGGGIRLREFYSDGPIEHSEYGIFILVYEPLFEIHTFFFLDIRFLEDVKKIIGIMNEQKLFKDDSFYQKILGIDVW